MMSPRRAPIALRTPISWVRSVTDISMMFITPTPPTSKPIELTTMVISALSHDLAELVGDCFGAGDAEIFGLVEGHMPAAAQQAANFVLGRGLLPGYAFGADEVSSSAGWCLLVGAVRDLHGLSAALVLEELALALREHADDW